MASPYVMTGLSSQNQLSKLVFMLLGLFVALSKAQTGLSQNLCSDENTGSSDTPNTSIYQSLGNCQGICSQNYAYAVVQGDSCWCSNTTPSNHLSISSCNDKCLGYPYENCGSVNQKLYGYLALSKKPSDPTSTSTRTSTTTEALSPIEILPPSLPPPLPLPLPPSPDIVVLSLTELPQTPASSSRRPTTRTLSSIVDVTTTEELRSSTTPTTPSVTTPITTQQVKTVSGSVITAFVTIMPTGVSNSEQQQPAKQKISSGSIVAIAVAVVIAAVVLLAALFIGFCCWKRKRPAYVEDGDLTVPQRNTSTLSKSGLIGSSSAGNSSDPYDRPGPMQERRSSKLLVTDQRLNPTAFMQHDDSSATSFVSMQDNRDYTRTLNVRNPDPHPD